MEIKTRNPFSGQELGKYTEYDANKMDEVLSHIRKNQPEWSRNLEGRIEYLKKTLRPNLAKKKEELAKLMSSEMGKPISQSLSEIDKCLNLLDFAGDKFLEFLEPEEVKTEGKKTYVRFDPLGTILLVMPWNYPLWQVMRAAVPAMFVGNGVVLKHASIVSGTSLLIDEIFESPVFHSIVASGARINALIPKVDGISVTGSTSTGIQIAQEAGKYLKKVVLELGGSDPFIVLKSANVAEIVEKATFARMQNNGQSCIASKRFVVHEERFDEFVEGLSNQFSAIKIGDPLEKATFLGPLSSKNQTEAVTKQIDDLRKIGKVESFGEFSRGIVPPTIAKVNGSYKEEVFGPVAIVSKFRTHDEAILLANDTPFGLGASIWGDSEEAEPLAPRIEAGMVFVNKIVASDPRVPFGGVKQSGIGRELSKFGLREFANVKTVWIDH